MLLGLQKLKPTSRVD